MKEFKEFDVKASCVDESLSVRECMRIIDRNKQGIALVVDKDGRLVGTVTDGDIRRFTLAGRSIDEPVSSVMWTNPLTAPVGTPESELKELMNRHLIRNIPLLDMDGRPQRIVNMMDFIGNEETGVSAVVMAGGEGRRLRPITDTIPKSLVKVGDRPVLEDIIISLARAGIVDIYISLNYMADLIEEYFNDGSRYGVRIRYLREDKKLGTVGPLTLLPEPLRSPLLVMNGDVVTRANLLRLIDFHREHRCVMTVAATQYKFDVPYGVINTTGHYLLGIEEKPRQKFLCNAGIYMVNAEVIPLIPAYTKFNMTDLIQEVVRRGLPVTTFPIHEYWIDIGQMEDLEKAQNDIGGC